MPALGVGDTKEHSACLLFARDPQVFWPGALIQGDSYESGSPLLVPTPNRAPLNISVQGLYAENASVFDVPPTQSEVNQAVSALLAGGDRPVSAPSSRIFSMEARSRPVRPTASPTST